MRRSPDFDVTVDAKRQTLHFVWRDTETIKHTSSMDGGGTWSSPEVVVSAGAAGGPRIAVDSVGRLHVAYGAIKSGARHASVDGRTFYTSLYQGAWSAPQEALVPTSLTHEFQIIGPRIAVDGSDNVHIIGWMLATGSKDWQMDSRCAYARRPRDSEQFEPTILFSYGKDGEGGGMHGDIVTDPAGDVHILYASYNRRMPLALKTPTTHLIRRKTGEWNPKVELFRPVATDFGMSVVVDARGVIHVAGQDWSEWSAKTPKAPIYWTYFNNAERSDELKAVHRINDDWEYASDLLLTPNGDVWISRGHWKPDRPFPWAGMYASMDSATGRWVEPESVSTTGFKNADSKYGQVPKFAYYDGRVHLFYAEQAPGEFFKFYQRIFGTSSGPVK